MMTFSVRDGDRGERDPRISESADGLAVGDVIPDEEPVPAALFSTNGEFGDQSGVGQLVEWGDENGSACAHQRHASSKARGFAAGTCHPKTGG